MLQSVRTLTKPVCRAAPVKAAIRGRKHVLQVRADEEMIPVINLPRRKHFSAKEQEQLQQAASVGNLGGKTIGEELTLIRARYLLAEEKAQQGESRLQSSNWDGDVYVGNRWNTLSVLYLVFLLTPLIGLMFAYVTYGSLWGTSALYGAPSIW